MNRTQFIRTLGLAVVILTLIGYTIAGVDLGAEEAATGTPSDTAPVAFSCEPPASADGASPIATQGEAVLELTGLARVDYANGDVEVSGIWRLPAGVSLQIEDGTQALVKVSDGAIVLGACGGDGVVDTKEGDDQVTQLADGDALHVESPSETMLFLDESLGGFHITASDSEGALVWIQVLGATADAVFCDEAQCWGMPDATPIPASLATPGAGCVGVRCWTK